MIEEKSMDRSHLSVEEVVDRIKNVMRVKKREGLLPLAESSDKSPGQKFDGLDTNIQVNNAKWSIVIERPITSHRKIIGPVLIFGRKVVQKYLRWLINPPLEQQREFNGSVTRSINMLRDIAYNHDTEINTQSNAFRLVEASIADIRNEQSYLHKEQSELDQVHRELRSGQEELRSGQEELRSGQEELRSGQEELRNHQDLLKNDLKVLYGKNVSGINAISDRLSFIERRLNEGQKVLPIVSSAPMSSEISTSFDYFKFEEKYRGSVEDIRERQKVYLEYFKGKKRVVDLGCGRGEFISLLLEHGISATGIDVNKDMISYCKSQGLPVIECDLFEYLEICEDESLDSIFSSQVIEHLSPDDVIKLINLSHKKLQPGGILILETINPQTVIAMSYYFYMDITHVRPVHPLTLQYIMESAAYHDIRILYLAEAKDWYVPALKFESAKSNLEEFNIGIEKLNRFLYGPQDYAIIGKK